MCDLIEPLDQRIYEGSYHLRQYWYVDDGGEGKNGSLLRFPISKKQIAFWTMDGLDVITVVVELDQRNNWKFLL